MIHGGGLAYLHNLSEFKEPTEIKHEPLLISFTKIQAKPVVKHVKRLIIEKDNNLYKDTKNVKFKMQDTNEYKPKGTPLSRYYTALR